jgi:copper chaperone CopZ
MTSTTTLRAGFRGTPVLLSLLACGLALLSGCATPQTSRHDGPNQGDPLAEPGAPARENSSGGAPAVEGPETVNTASVVMTVEGMSCPMCARNVLAYMTDVEGVEGVEFDLGEGLVTLATDPKAGLTKAILRDAVWESGFTLRRIELR